jgi:hypothetical protein
VQEKKSMVKVVSVAASVALMVALTVTPARAHHSFAAEFDAKRPVKLRGTVVKMEWINPHSWIHMDVKTAPTGPTDVTSPSPTARSCSLVHPVLVRRTSALRSNGQTYAGSCSVDPARINLA